VGVRRKEERWVGSRRKEGRGFWPKERNLVFLFIYLEF
jgi:hypothetical protein